MNPEELKQKIAYYYERLPANVQGMFASMSWLETLKRISGKFGLNDQQIQTLGTETTLVLLGIIPMPEYERNISKELGLRGENLENLLMEINGLILNPVRVELNKVYEINTTEEIEEKPAAQNPEPKVAESTPKPDYADALLEVSRKHSLSVTQMGVLEGLIKGVLDGSGDAARFEQALEKGAWLSREKAHEVTLDVNEQVFRTLRKEMMAAAGDKSGAEIFKSAGIEVEPQKPIAEIHPLATKPAPGYREEALKKIENPDLLTPERELPAPHDIHVQKLSGAYQAPKKETHYEEKNEEKKPDAAKPGTDPYREPI